MAHQVEGQVFTGAHVADASPLGGKLYDLPPGETQGLQREKEGMSDVVVELETAAPTLPVIAEPYTQFVALTALIGQIRAARVVVDKLAEVLAESEAKYEHERENAVGMIVDAVKSAAKRNGGEALKAIFEKTLAYAAQVGVKAAITRQKNAAAKKAGKDAGDK